MTDDPPSEGSIPAPPPEPPWLTHPVSAERLTENPGFDTVFVSDSDGPLTAEDWAVLAGYMSRYPQLYLDVKYLRGGLPDLEFLADFGWLTRLYVSSRDLESVGGLRHVPDLEKLVLGPSKRRISLEVLKELPKLVSLSVSEHSRSLDVIAEIPTLRGLSLDGAKRDNLEFLARAPHLAILYATYGRFGDLSALAGLPKLKMLTMVRTKVTDLAPLGQCTALQYLHLESLPVGYGQLPDLSNLTELTAVELNLKHLDDLSAIATAPNLRYLRVGSDILLPEQFALLADHPTLEYLDAGLRNDTLSYRTNDVVGVPRDVHWVYRSDFRVALTKQIFAD